VSQNASERTLGKLATDDEFRARFFENLPAATWEAGLPLHPSSSRRSRDCHRRRLPDSVRASRAHPPAGVSRRRRPRRHGTKQRAGSKRPEASPEDMTERHAIVIPRDGSCSRGCSSIRAASRCPWFRRWWCGRDSPAGAARAVPSCWRRRRRSARRGHGLVWHRTLARRPGSESARSGPTPTEGLDRSHRARIPRA